jgi:hypothetical protein
MRELANESARSAITTSTQVSAVRAVRGKFAIAAAAGVTAVAILTLSNGIVSLATGVSLGCFAAAGWFGYDGFRSRRRLQAQSANDCAGSTTDDHN